MVEYDSSFLAAYKHIRPKSFYEINDARTVDYRLLLDTYEFPHDIDYLQVDLDVDNRSTLDVIELLDRTVLDKYRFACMTIEHDIYSGDYFNTRARSREIFKSRGYTLLFPDVRVWWQNDYKPFEDWYVHPDLAPHMIQYATTESLPGESVISVLCGKQ